MTDTRSAEAQKRRQAVRDQEAQDHANYERYASSKKSAQEVADAHNKKRAELLAKFNRKNP